MPFDANALAQLRTDIHGDVFVPGEEGYAREVAGFNLLSSIVPDIVVGADDEADVQAAVRWAGANGLTVHPQSTGHGAYRALDHGLLLKTNRLTSITVDPEAATWTMGSGLRWMDVLPHLHQAGLGAVTGSAKTVGVVGIAMGGGIGPVGRTLGMVADWVRSFRVVDAKGDVLVASPTEHEDLFWALRGGKVGLGVVTQATFAAPRMPFVYGGGIYYPEADIDRLFHAWLDWTEGKPESVNTSAAVLQLPPSLPDPLGGQRVFHLRYTYAEIGATHEQLRERGEAFLQSWREVAGPGLVDRIGVLPSDRIGEVHADPEGPIPLWEWGDFLRPIDHDFIDAVLTTAGAGTGSPLSTVEVRLLGGAVARDPELPSAIGGRRQPYTLLVLGEPDDTEARQRHLIEASAYAIRDAAEPWSGAEVNYHWANHPSKDVFENRLWPRDVAARLTEVRRRYDPTGMFEFGN